MTGQLASNFWQERDFSLLHCICTGCGPTQHPVYILRALSAGVKESQHEGDHLLSSKTEDRSAWSYTSSYQYVFIMWCWIEHNIMRPWKVQCSVRMFLCIFMSLWVKEIRSNVRFWSSHSSAAEDAGHLGCDAVSCVSGSWHFVVSFCFHLHGLSSPFLLDCMTLEDKAV
jgi:hypothetical protein